MCFFHWIQSFNKHSKQFIAHEFHDQHKAFYYDYKKTLSLEEADLQYATIHNCDGIHLELLARALFKGSTIGSVSCTFVCDNGKVSCWM
jgi:hypothetical protein